MSNSPYSPPNANLTEVAEHEPVPEDILKKIKNAWQAGIVSTVFTLLITLVAMSGSKFADIDAWNLLDVPFIAGLTFGIYKKSRVCATLMFLYFLASKIYLVYETGNFSGLVMGVLFCYFYFQGMMGTFAYHQHFKSTTA